MALEEPVDDPVDPGPGGSLENRVNSFIGAVGRDVKHLRAAAGQALLEAAKLSSKGTDLVINGTGSMGDNTNFTSFVFDGSDTPVGAAGSFFPPAGLYTFRGPNELIPINPAKKYKASVDIRQTGTSTDGQVYLAASFVDTAGLSIAPEHIMYVANTVTTLAAPLNPGDATVSLVDSTNWYGRTDGPAGQTYQRRIIFWDYVDKFGKLWEPESYSRNLSVTDAWAAGSINPATHVIVLRAPYNGPAKPAGTKVSNGASGASYLYWGGTVTPTDEWMTYSGVMSGINYGPTGYSTNAANAAFPKPAAAMKILFGANKKYGTTSNDLDSAHKFANVSVSDASAAQDTADKKITTYYQNDAPPSWSATTGDLWFDTNDKNKPHYWDGNSWKPIRDQAILDAQATADAAVASYVAHEAAENPHPQYRDQPPPENWTITKNGVNYVVTANDQGFRVQDSVGSIVATGAQGTSGTNRLSQGTGSYGISEWGVYSSRVLANQEATMQLDATLGLLIARKEEGGKETSFISSPQGVQRLGYGALNPNLPDVNLAYPGTGGEVETLATREWVADELMYGRLVNPSALYPWQASLGRAHTQPSNIVVVGDSITEGTGATNFFATWPSRLQAVLRAQKHHIGGGVGYIAAAPTTNGVVPALPLTTSGVTYQMGKFGLGGRVALIGNTAGDHVTYNPQQCTQVRVWFSKGWFGGGLRIEIDGVDQLANVSSNAPTVNDEKGGEVWTSPVLAPGLHTVKISCTTTGYPVFLEGVEFFNNDVAYGTRVYNAGHYGYTTADFITMNMQKHWESVWKLNPSLGIIVLGANDLAVSGMTGATFASNLTTLISRFPSTTPILILLHPQRGDYQTAANTLLWSQMKASAQALATGRVAFLDMQDWWPTLSATVSDGQGLMFDTVHPSNAGMETYAEVVREHVGYPFRRR